VRIFANALFVCKVHVAMFKQITNTLQSFQLVIRWVGRHLRWFMLCSL